MCGIVVVKGKTGTRLLTAMLKKIRHRGPDDEGIFIKDDIMLGHARLSIIDVSGGKQPIFNETGDKCVVFNGEIYNHRLIKKSLKEKHTFKTNTDTEAIIHLYEEKGFESVKDLDGMFAFAIYDNKNLFLARDPLGIKPLYYGIKNSVMFFTSEIKSLVEVTDNINEFPPGYFYSTETGFQKYIDISPTESINYELETAMLNIRNKLEKAVEKRLMSDVPVGAFLSGGIDSSIITALMKKYLGKLSTFSVGMENSLDIQYAREVAKYFGTDHYEFIYTKKELLNSLPEVIYYLESFDSALVRSSIPCYFVSKLAKEHNVKVILTGEGSDELFAGYHYLKEYKNDKELQKETINITLSLHNTNLQRVDRMSMANSVEARVPFLDIDFLEYVISLPISIKKSKPDSCGEEQYEENKIEKWLLRKTFERYLPSNIVWRKKKKFSEGAGSSEVIKKEAEKTISDSEFEKEKKLMFDFEIKDKEELYNYRIFRNFYPQKEALRIIGRSHSL